MAQRRFHYEAAFEHYLRVHRVPYIAVDEAKRALVPEDARARFNELIALKSFDFVVYGPRGSVLVDVKGRRLRGRSHRYENWVSTEDIASMDAWARLFGPRFRAIFVFCYWCDAQPPDALFEEVFAHGGRWYAMKEVSLGAYRREMVPRSRKWATVQIPQSCFGRLARPFSVRARGSTISACDDAALAIS